MGDDLSPPPPQRRRTGKSGWMEGRLREAAAAVERQNVVARAYAEDAEEIVASSSAGGALSEKGFGVEAGVTWRRLGAGDKQALLAMLERNMKGHYPSSTWDRVWQGKKRDMASREARYLILRSRPGSGVAGFCNYRFLVEDEEWIVLYVYELQVSQDHRRRGVGKNLTDLCQLLAERTEMQGVMLTTLKCNEGACRFYEREGFTPSVIDPTVVCPERAAEFDYRILARLFSEAGGE
ncbi:N-acetyltransferase [Chloropicon primus]|nr:N-acetyltransferase [Chloropicon primus]